MEKDYFVGKLTGINKLDSINPVYCMNEELDFDTINYYVYLHKRSTDDSIFYVGKGKGKRCFSKHDRNDHWINIVCKYGYKIEIIKWNLTEEEAHTLEKELIEKYGRVDLGTGILCNQTDGGEGSSGIIITEETKAVWSEQKSGINNPMYGKRFFGERNPNYGNKGALNSISKPVIALDLKGNYIKEYPSAASTAEDGYNPGAVSNCCTGRRPQHGNTQFVFKEDYDPNKTYVYKRGLTTVRAVIKFNKECTEIEEYYASLADVENYGYSRNNVYQVCSGAKHTHKGFKWAYFDSLPEDIQNKITNEITSKI